MSRGGPGVVQDEDDIFEVSVFQTGVDLSPNLPYSEGIDSPTAAIPLLKGMQREKLCRGILKCTARAFF